MPPFLDGRTIFTKQPEPVVPVKGKGSKFRVCLFDFFVYLEIYKKHIIIYRQGVLFTGQEEILGCESVVLLDEFASMLFGRTFCYKRCICVAFQQPVGKAPSQLFERDS